MKKFRIHQVVLLAALALMGAPVVRADDASGIIIHGNAERRKDGKSNLHIFWECQRDNVASFEVEEKIDDGSGTNYHIVYLAPGGKTGEYVEPDITIGVDYLFRIRADFNDGTVSNYR